MKISNMKSSRGNEVPNQFMICGIGADGVWTENGNLPSGDAFQSYRTLIAFRDFRGNLFLDRDRWNYSNTTSRYRNQFTGYDSKATKKLIDSGEIQLVDLNC